MSPALTHFEMRALSFPRVSGDEPQIQHTVGGVSTFSPRERG